MNSLVLKAQVFEMTTMTGGFWSVRKIVDMGKFLCRAECLTCVGSYLFRGLKYLIGVLVSNSAVFSCFVFIFLPTLLCR